MQFNKQTGWLQHYVVGGRSLLEDTLGLTANFWRSPTNYDYSYSLPLQLSAWKRATREPRLQLFSTSTSTDFVIVRADYLLPEVKCLLHVHYTVNARGEMQVEEVLEVDSTQVDTVGTGQGPGGSPMLPRMGMKWFLPAGYDSVTYYGRGPWENYADRCDGSFVGVYRQTVEELLFPYARPQECGNRTDVRWWKITDKQGLHGFMIAADSALLSISALHYFGDDLDDGDSLQRRRMSDLPPRPQVQLNIDHRQMGLSGMKPYRLPFGNYHYIYKVTPL
jgi:beta-galactosidase